MGIRFMKEHRGWNELTTLNLNTTGLTYFDLTYLGEATMPKLKRINIIGNKFTDIGKIIINGLRMNHISVNYLTQAEREEYKEYEERRKEIIIKEKQKEGIKKI